jgi:hypothetical protein
MFISVQVFVCFSIAPLSWIREIAEDIFPFKKFLFSKTKTWCAPEAVKEQKKYLIRPNPLTGPAVEVITERRVPGAYHGKLKPLDYTVRSSTERKEPSSQRIVTTRKVYP